jgi:hypothetical protein
VFTSYVLSIYVKRDNPIIFSILCDEIKKFFFVNLIKYNSDTTKIARYFIERIIVNIVVVVAIYVALSFSTSLAIRLLFEFLSQFIDIIKRLFF